MQISVTGMIAAGKTTLIDNLSSELDYKKVHESNLGLSHLERLFKNPNRWGFQAQTAFLIDKANAIMKLNNEKKPFFVDRSLDEDAKIFFEYFKEAHDIDELTNKTYQTLYNLLSSFIPQQSIQIVCPISKSDAIKRIMNRDKFNSYVDGYIDSIFSKYEKFIDNLHGKTNVFLCDSAKHDWTKKENYVKIANDIQTVIKNYNMVENYNLCVLEEFK